jgi:hypothetical protein
MASVTLEKRVLETMIRTTPNEIALLLDKEAETIVNNIKLSFGTGPPGRTYARGARFHIASQPRFPPNVDTGLLRARMRWQRQGRFTRLIMDGVEYGVYLELGTTKVAPRPFVVPEMAKAFSRLPETFKRSGIFK